MSGSSRYMLSGIRTIIFCIEKPTNTVLAMIDKSINKNIDKILLKLKTVPESPGVYQHLDAQGKVIYVGKAKNLQRRVSSYFTRYEAHSSKIKMLIRHIYDFRITVVPTEVDALLLENNLIKQYQPRYNSLLKDDKSYPYLCITDEDFPQVLFTRDRTRIKGHFYGPYPNQKVLRELQDIIRKLFTYRTCHHHLTVQIPNGKRPVVRPCINHQIGLCDAPCAGLQSQADYLNTIQNIRRILRGDFDDIISDLKDQMFALSEQQRFEEAEVFHRKIQLLQEYQSKSTVVNTSVKDVDVFTILSDSQYAYINMMRIKHGSIIYSFSSEIKKQLDESDSEILSTIIPELHQKIESTAHEVILQAPVEDLPQEYLKQVIPTRGDKKELLELSLRNARTYQMQCSRQRMLVNPDAGRTQLLERLQQSLHLPQLPVHIECFDNSNIQGAYPVAAMVRFTNGRPDKKEYRTYNIKTVEGPDDYASMEEVIYRRYKRLSEEQKELPQLLIVDGGEGQMEMARRVISEQLHLDIPIAGLAKDNHHKTSQLLYGFPPQVVGLKLTDPLFHLLEQIQNEVHRFAITFHRNKRSKGTFKTQLTDIPGIGEKTATELLMRFGSVKNIRKQSFETLAAVTGQAKARQIIDFFQTN